MASINLSGVLRDPLGEVSYGNIVKFTHETTTGETLGGFASALTVEINGDYDIDLEYGNVLIETYDKINSRWIKHGTYTINSETPAASLPSLIGITTPLSDQELLVVQNLVADAEAARDDAQTAQSNTEALFNDFDTIVSESTALNNSNLAFEANFNDSLNISKGYGTYDTITIASETVDLSTKSVDFTCASERTVINKSGDMDAVGVDAPAIGVDGEWLHGSYTNETPWSENLSNMNTDGSVLTPALYSAETVPGRGVSPYTLVPSTESGVHRALPLFSAVTGDVVSVRIIAKAFGYDNFRIRSSQTSDNSFATFSLVDGSLIDSNNIVDAYADSIGDGYFELNMTFIADRDTTNQGLTMISTPDDNNGDFAGDGVSGALITQISIVRNFKNAPYIKTEGSAMSVGATVASIQKSNNLPADGKPFTIRVDTSIPIISGATKSIFRTSQGASNLVAWRYQGSTQVEFKLKDASEATQVAFIQTDEERHRFAFRFSNDEISIFIDGVFKKSEPCVGSTLDFDDIILGRDLNSQMKNFKIYFGDVSDNTIASWGGPQ